MSNVDQLRYFRMQERLDALRKEKKMSETRIAYLYDATTGGQVFDGDGKPLFTRMVGTALLDGTVRMYLTESEHEHIRQIIRGELAYAIQYQNIREIVREEIANAFCVHQQQELDSLLEAVQGEPDPDDEIAAILAEMSESEWEAVVQKVKEMKEKIVEAQQQ